jgi:Ser/Thr protein kinase RdoA (MazF antagonist)
MRAFNQLSKMGRTERLRQLAAATLADDFGITALKVSLISAHSFNTLFRADTAGGPLAVRVGEVRIHAHGVEEVEADWLATIGAETNLPVPTLLADRHGHHVAHHVAPGVHLAIPGKMPCSVMTWVRGRPARDHFDLTVPRQLGVVQAMLHEQASTYRPPAMPTGIIANRVIYFADTSLLAVFESPYGSLFREAIDRVQHLIDALWNAAPHPPHLIHGDIGPHNVMRWRDRLAPIDFQDLQFGFDVQDLGITLSDLRRNYGETLIDGFKTGYRSVRPWPSNDKPLEDALAAARSLNVLNLGLNLRRPGLVDHIDRHAHTLDGERDGGPSNGAKVATAAVGAARGALVGGVGVFTLRGLSVRLLLNRTAATSVRLTARGTSVDALFYEVQVPLINAWMAA